jgi:glucose dehydrogenase|tara:strand:- start:21925 stop:22293 length:369 start_codon:yes stop_codon:yes gene_type:complete
LLTKILFTLAVILVVALVFRVKNTPAKPAAAAGPAASKGGVSAAMVAYTLLGLVIAISALVFVLHWQNQHRVIDIQVTNSQGQALKYQAYKKAIEGRRFTTIDGVSVDLADSDRIEILENND